MQLLASNCASSRTRPQPTNDRTAEAPLLGKSAH